MSPAAAPRPAVVPGPLHGPFQPLARMLLVGLATLVANGTPLASTLSEGLFQPLAYNVLQFGVPAVLLTLGANTLVDARRLPAWLAYPAVVLATVLGGIWLIAPQLYPLLGRADWWGHREDLELATSTVAWHAMGMTVYVQLRRSRQAQARLQALQDAAAARRQQLAAAQLLALQARVDPALLSERLGQIDTELQQAPPRALRRLAALIELLRAQQPHLDAELSTLDRELDALRAYARLSSPDPGEDGSAGRLHLAGPALAHPPAWPLAPLVLLPLVRPLLEEDGTLWTLALRHAPGRAELRLQALGPDAPRTRRAAARVPVDELQDRLRAVHGLRASLQRSDDPASAELPGFLLSWPVPAAPRPANPLHPTSPPQRP